MNETAAATETRKDRSRFRLWLRRGAAWVDFALYVFKRGQKDQFLRVAASLSYTSLIALVPLLAIFSAFPAFSSMRGQLEGFISQSMLPNTGNSVQVYLRQFISATGKLTTGGVVGLGVTALLTLTTIDTAFNAIFRVARQRPMVSRILVYWAVLTFGPLLLGASSSLSGGLFALRKTLTGATFDGVSAWAVRCQRKYLSYTLWRVGGDPAVFVVDVSVLDGDSVRRGDDRSLAGVAGACRQRRRDGGGWRKSVSRWMFCRYCAMRKKAARGCGGGRFWRR